MSPTDEQLQLIRDAMADDSAEVREEQRGQFNDVLFVDERYVFRFPRSEPAAQDMAREIAILDIVRQRVSLPVPGPLLVQYDDLTGLPRFMGYEMIPGRALTYSDVNEANREPLARQLAGFLWELHDTPLADLPEAIETGELPAAWASFYRGICDQLFGYMREEARGRIARDFEAYFEDPHRYSFDTRLRHGDFGIGNILWDPEEGRVTGIIDFGSCQPGDPAQDLGALLISFGSAFVEEVYRHYPELEDMYHRAVFYTGTYTLQQAMAALRDGDDAMFEDAIARFR